ncbi:MAG: 2-oxoglutarate/2-oxoacid ferredoxin oxidoreductase, beta subunit [Ktedonobacterales bacterium]|jgi:2-oxoglutarate ferredoxin oxidoreductase subunit beta|nr:MAG: 2-oxoglutarate/2-oxoacid ferredoxin oxidoreductase, beta subunit [Ktedonobacterales bacterium]
MAIQEPPAQGVNLIGLTRGDYKGRASTLCKGCGHDSISARIISVAYDLSLKPSRVIKLSGIGCSSKTPAYFLNQSHGFNGLHGRMPSMATGATLANRDLLAIGISGDGDTGSIGMGQFKHMVRRNVPVVYIVEDNGVYGLTKGQFSATADEGQKLKYAGLNELPPIDLCMEAIIAECGFVARSFAGDPRQVEALLKAAMSHRGTAILDIVSPCVSFNDHEESTKSYSWGKAHEEVISDFNFIPARSEITVDYAEGTSTVVEMHDGSHIVLKKLDNNYDPRDKMGALRMLDEAREKQEFITGLIYLNEERPSLPELERLPDTPLATLPQEQLRPSRETLDKLMRGMM